MENPRARKNNLVSQIVGEELVIVDRDTNRAHRMNKTAAAVWQHCDGHHSVDQIASKLQITLPVGDSARAVTENALEQFKDLNLLEGQGIFGRRELAQRLAIGAALMPIVASIAVPTPARAQSGVVTYPDR